MPAVIEGLEKRIAYEFNNKAFLMEALTHGSYFQRCPDWPHCCNERLEFLGDVVLGLTVTEILLDKYPKYREGQLTILRAALVNNQVLSGIAKEIKLAKYLLISAIEFQAEGRMRDHILANAVEALIGAIYSDGGHESCRAFVNKLIVPKIPEMIQRGVLSHFDNPKSLLQIRVASKWKTSPQYEVIGIDGPDHDKVFKVGVYIDQTLISTGHGGSINDAKIAAAKIALEELNCK